MQVLRYAAPREAAIVEAEDPRPGAGQFVARSLYCNISAGTEMGFYRGTAPQLNARYDRCGNFVDAPGAMQYPLQSNFPGTWWMGYANVSEVVAVGAGVTKVKAGDRLYAHKPHQTLQLFNEDEDYSIIPEGYDLLGASLTALTEIAFNGALDLNPRLKENIVVFGLGTVGQLTVAMAKASGARVIAVDALPDRLAMARAAGAEELINFMETKNVAEKVYDLTGGRGADGVVEVSGNVKALTTAMQAAAVCGRVACLSFYPDGAASLNLGREFHHKHLNLISTQIGNINPALQKWWDPARRLKAALELTQELNVKRYVTHVIAYRDLPQALQMIDQRSSECGAVCIDYGK